MVALITLERLQVQETQGAKVTIAKNTGAKRRRRTAAAALVCLLIPGRGFILGLSALYLMSQWGG